MSQSNHEYSEKREYIRMQVETPATLHHAGQAIPALCRDLSATGMQLEAACNLQVGDKVKISIESEHPQLKGLTAEAEVVRVNSGDGDKQIIGVNVLSMR
ncbi:PilZ domain-containing protein [Pseudomonas sp. M30-35]|uniref:PilZ domain-containing protein n=1 Tax=Pseudomonas sp. M30-35 TaxID=1981174 RepID=UPI000B3CD2C4|nr:PilZ domain-containing protein [Pseudomonas sp. M30-35]ARU88979.1 PilZ domain-containing protein [Pseudomonas sp. M30-35]